MRSVLAFVLLIGLFWRGEAKKSLRTGKSGLLKTILAADGENTSIFAQAIKQFEKSGEKDENFFFFFFRFLERESRKAKAKVEELTAKVEELIPAKRVRLLGVNNRGKVPNKSGRLEVWYKGEWGTVCGELFDDNDAAVVCRTMGLTGGEKLFSGGYEWFRQDWNKEVKEIELGRVGNGPIWIDDPACTGSEQDFLECPRLWNDEMGEHNCNHNEDVFMKCDGNHY